MMRLLSGFSALSLISGALLAILPEGTLRRTASMVIGLLMLFFWVQGLSDLCGSLPEALAGDAGSALASTGIQLSALEAAAVQEVTP